MWTKGELERLARGEECEVAKAGVDSSSQELSSSWGRWDELEGDVEEQLFLMWETAACVSVLKGKGPSLLCQVLAECPVW